MLLYIYKDKTDDIDLLVVAKEFISVYSGNTVNSECSVVEKVLHFSHKAIQSQNFCAGYFAYMVLFKS